ncbi:MAG: rRNA methyltransferase [Hydrocarboniphaga sp.]|uniref:class I SAM-dependent methyltransferase n=1 Tax=Hydrocarboniphaga sp. TaxID=2033016 RepID=UPI002602A192|nr:class I SAM-dependent methyltransferase [Hydrocarboniphaga sp.]MDB5970768.1 rRNA methyltransferase [Hydrocarboniphaga sp.]
MAEQPGRERDPADQSSTTTLGGDARGFSFALETLAGALSLRALHRPDWEPLSLDWTSAELRRRILGGRKQLLPRALGMQKKLDIHVVDATAGLGRDGFTLAALGATVTLLERQPMMAALLRDAQRRALDSPLSKAAQRIRVVEGDAIQWLAQTSGDIDAVHLDPMYPDDGKTALPQKAMQMLRELTGGDADAAALLDAALASPARRVAVKRGAKAGWLGERKPTHELSGTQARYDIYLNSR